MKNIILLIILSLTVLGISGCPANPETTDNTTKNAGNTTTDTTANKETNAANNSAASTTEKKTEIKGFPPSELKPESISAAKPVPAGELRNAVFAWVGKEISVIGYPMFPRMISRSVRLKGSADADSMDRKNTLVECANQYKDFENQEVDEKQPLVLKGTIARYPNSDSDNQIVRIENCQLVSIGEFSGEKGTADIAKIDASKPIPAADLHKDFFKWHGKDVAVVGNFNGSTTSSNKGEVLDIRIDVANEKREKVVGCHVSSETGEVKERDNRIFKGKIAGSTFDQLSLEPCEFVK